MSLDDARYGQFRKDYSWQEESIENFVSQIDTFYSVERGRFPRPYVNEVSPSGGKTIFSMKLARRLIADGLIDRVIWCVPRDSIKLGFRDDARQIEMPEAKRLIKTRFIRIDTDLTATYKGALPNHHGMVITYQALPRLLGYFDLLCNKHRLMFVFDEAHHGSIGEDDDAMNIWGDAMEKCRSLAHAIVCMTGTPLRSDAKRIPFVRYTAINATDGRSGYQVEPDYSFSYQKAVTAGIARKIVCRSQDTEITYEVDGVSHRSPVSLIPAAHLNKVKNTAFCFDRGVIDAYLKIAHEECERLRKKTGDDDAAILIIGRRDLNGESSLADIAKRIQVLFGETAVTVESADGPDAREAIAQFKYGKGRWIVAKEMISEGTNLPRLRIVVILRDIGNRTFYEQLVHRVTRNDADDRPQDAFIIQLQLPKLHEWACDLEHQALIGWNKRPREPGPDGPPGPTPPPPPLIEGICAEQQRETVVIENQDFTETDPTARILVDRIPQTRLTRWQANMTLKELQGLGIPLNGASSTPPDKEELFSIDEQIKRYRESGYKNCKRAAVNLGGGDTYGRIIGQCKKAAGIKGSLENVSRDHRDPLEAMKRFAEAARRAFENSRRPVPDTGEQGALL